MPETLSPRTSNGPRIAVVGATGAVGPVTLRLLRERGFASVRAFASRRSVGTRVEGIPVEEATADTLGAGDLDVCFFSIGTELSAELVPQAVAAGAACSDQTSGFRPTDRVTLRVPAGKRAPPHGADG